MSRMWAIVEREMRRFRRSPVLIAMSMVFPLAQLVILGYAFGGNVKHLKVAIVDQDGGVPAVRIRELGNAVAANARTFDMIPYADQGQAVADLRNGRVEPLRDDLRRERRPEPHDEIGTVRVGERRVTNERFVRAHAIGVVAAIILGDGPNGSLMMPTLAPSSCLSAYSTSDAPPGPTVTGTFQSDTNANDRSGRIATSNGFRM